MIQYNVLDDIVEMDKGQEESLLKELVSLFQTQTPLQFQKINHGLTNKDATEIGRAAHTLKSSCSYLGAMEMVDICKKLETIQKGVVSWDEGSALYQRLQELFATDSEDLRQYVKKVIH